MTRTLTDPITAAATGLEREIVLEGGEKGLARLDYLGEGKRKITIFDNENRPFLWETKTVTREEGGSVFGGENYTLKQLVTKNPHSPELQAQRGESEYIKMNRNTHLFRPYKP